MIEYVKIIFEEKTYKLPVIVGSEGEKAIDTTKLRQLTGLIALDPGFASTGSCISSITFVDGEKGILRYRGIPIEQLADHSSFIETAYLLINGVLPTQKELSHFSDMLNDESPVHEDMLFFFQNFPRASHPIGILSSMVNVLRSFYPEFEAAKEEFNKTVALLLSKVRTMAAISYKTSKGQKVVYPRSDLSFCANFLNMIFNSHLRPYQINEEVVKALNIFWILHADHEQNCSTSTVRIVGSGRVNLYAAISAGISALGGPLHGGANQAVIEMLSRIVKSGDKAARVIERAKDKKDPFRLMGFGHRVYKTYDPRARIMKKACDNLLAKLNISDPLFDLAKEIEEVALNDDYFIEQSLYPNIDFYSGIILRAIGIPINMFTVMFAIGRLPGWIAQWKESMDDPDSRLIRPRQIYNGHTEMKYTPIDER